MSAVNEDTLRSLEAIRRQVAYADSYGLPNVLVSRPMLAEWEQELTRLADVMVELEEELAARRSLEAMSSC